MNFSHQLLSWYQKNKRDLPWRRSSDPYLVWLSEVILQQTRIDQGLPYYEKFVAAYPTIQHLAGAGEQEILKLWQGLGYYSRARNMHEASRMIVRDFDGKFPATYEGIRSLKGVGDYTAAAIASIVFDLPYPVVDGNVIRFFSRYFGITGSAALSATKKQILEIATEKIDHRHPGDFNQAVMEFGATFCVPANPSCATCIFRSSCFALKQGMVAELPARSLKAAIRNRYLHYLVITCTIGGEDFIGLNKRTGNDIWKNLFDFPQIEFAKGRGQHNPQFELHAGNRQHNPQVELHAGNRQHYPQVEHPEGIKQDHPLNARELGILLGDNHPGLAIEQFLGVSPKYNHLLTHQRLHAWFYRFHSETKAEWPSLLVAMNKLNEYPVPRMIEKYIHDQVI